ncbi:hypothetical protein cypCar_00024174 [Cyprinus carpio]|nr:hypothetical protein cypCar_00024174 [Cyprinus carpio]
MLIVLREEKREVQQLLQPKLEQFRFRKRNVHNGRTHKDKNILHFIRFLAHYRDHELLTVWLLVSAALLLLLILICVFIWRWRRRPNKNQISRTTDTDPINPYYSIIDDVPRSEVMKSPAVQWENLQTSDSGYYWCAVEIGDYGTLDDRYYLYLTVQSAPDVSVVSSSVSGHEGGDISVQCFYSSGYKNKLKQWCRYKDKSCYTVGRTVTSQISSVQISDNGRRSFTVQMTGLRLTDSGWYYCSVGDLQVPVQLTVTEPKRAFTTIPATAPSDSEADIAMIADSKPETDRSDVILVTCLISMFMLLLIVTLVTIVTWGMRKKPGVESYDGWSNHVLTVQTGGSVTIPCYYDKKYTQQKKYWFSKIDKSKTYTNTTEQNLSVIDHPDQSFFTVTMRNLQNKHNGYYYCVVETGEQPPIKRIYEPYLKIQSAPDVSVVNSSVSGHEGGDISVQCFYSSRYQNEVKQWCRYKDQSCYTVGRTDTSQISSVQISDDGSGSFTVRMTGLRLTDSGWYFCSAEEAINPVHITVTEAEPHKEKDTSVFKHFSLTFLRIIFL